MEGRFAPESPRFRPAATARLLDGGDVPGGFAPGEPRAVARLKLQQTGRRLARALHVIIFTVGLTVFALFALALLAAFAGGWGIAITAVLIAAVVIPLSRRRAIWMKVGPDTRKRRGQPVRHAGLLAAR